MTPLPSPSPPLFDPGSASSLPSLTYGVGVLFIICVGAYFMLRFLYGRGPQARQRMGRKLLHVIEHFPLGRERYVLLVEVAGQILLLGVTEHSINFLTQLDSELLSKEIPLSEQAGGGAAPFTSYLSALSRRWKKNKEEPSHD